MEKNIENALIEGNNDETYSQKVKIIILHAIPSVATMYLEQA
jgi:hypothetical protein